MLNFIIGRAGSGKSLYCLNEIKKKISTSPMGAPLILILPEHMTFKVERELANMLDAPGYFRAYVYGFRRFARQLLLSSGGMALPRITEVGRRILLKKIVNKRENELLAFRQASTQRSFTQELSEAIKEFKSYKLGMAEINAGLENLEGRVLPGKMQDLSLIINDFNESMAGRYNDGEDVLNLAIEKIKDADWLNSAEVWLDGFYFFNPQEQGIIRELMARGLDVHITLTMDSNIKSYDNVSRTGIFAKSYQTYNLVKQIAREVNQEITEDVLLKETNRFEAEAISSLENILFSRKSEQSDAGEGITLLESANARVEVETVACDIKRICREKNYKYKDIGILIRGNNYDVILPLILEDYGIPYFIDGKRYTMHHPLAELLRSVFEVVRSWNYESVFRMLRTGFFNLSQDNIDKLENYVLKYGIRGKKRWLQEEPWHWQDNNNEADKLSLERINYYRVQVINPLKPFMAELAKEKDIAGITTALYDLLERLEVPQKLELLATEAEKNNKLDRGAEHRQIWKKVIELFDQMVEMGAEEKISRKSYEQMLLDGIDALEISLIPPGFDYVTVAPLEQNSLDNIKALYILGVNEGVIPGKIKSKGLFTDADKLHLQEAGLEISAGGAEKSLQEKYIIYKALTLPKNYLCLSYAMTDQEGGGLMPSSLINKIRDKFPKVNFLAIPLAGLDAEENTEAELSELAKLRISAGENTISGLVSALESQKENGKLSPWWSDVYNFWLKRDNTLAENIAFRGLILPYRKAELNKNIASSLYIKNGKLRGNVTRFECFAKCPFQHYAQFGLKLKERKIQEFSALDLGILMHETVYRFGEKLKAEGRNWRDVSEEEIEEFADSVVAEIEANYQNDILSSTPKYKHQLERIKIVATESLKRMAAMDSVSKFHPQVFERNFGKGENALPPLTYKLDSGEELEITGQIDRLDYDENGRYFMVVDYKTGKAEINLLEVYLGIKIQLLTYLLVAKNLFSLNNEERLPAGILYCYLRYNILTDNTKLSPDKARRKLSDELKMSGWILAEPEVVKEIDATGNFIRVKMNKDGSIGKSYKGSVKTYEEFEMLLDYVNYLLEYTGKRILAGDIEPSPIKNKEILQCTFCPYEAVCGFDLTMPNYKVREISTIKEDSIWEKIENTLEGGEEDGVD